MHVNYEPDYPATWIHFAQKLGTTKGLWTNPIVLTNKLGCHKGAIRHFWQYTTNVGSQCQRQMMRAAADEDGRVFGSRVWMGRGLN